MISIYLGQFQPGKVYIRGEHESEKANETNERREEIISKTYKLISNAGLAFHEASSMELMRGIYEFDL